MSDADVVLLHAHEPAVEVHHEPAIGVCWQLLQTDEPEMSVRVLHAPEPRLKTDGEEIVLPLLD